MRNLIIWLDYSLQLWRYRSIGPFFAHLTFLTDMYAYTMLLSTVMALNINKWDGICSKCHFLSLVFIHLTLVDTNIRINPRLVNFPLGNGCTYIIISIYCINLAILLLYLPMTITIPCTFVRTKFINYWQIIFIT